MAVYALGDRLPTIHPDAYVHPDATVIGDVTLGAGSSVWPGAVLRGDYGTITVGERTSSRSRSERAVLDSDRTGAAATASTTLIPSPRAGCAG